MNQTVLPPLFAHQAAEIAARSGVKRWCLFWEPGTAKSRTVIEIVANAYRAKDIDTFVVVTDNGVHASWATDELPTWMPKDIPWKVMLYDSRKAKQKGHKWMLEHVLAYGGLRILCISYDAAGVTQAGKDTLWRFLKGGKTFFVADESSAVKTPDADRTGVLRKAAKYGAYRWIMNGTPVEQGPLDLYSQIAITDERFWEREFNITTFGAFKGEFALYQMCKLRPDNEGKQAHFDKLVGYKNLDKLNAAVAKISSRVLKDEVLDLPPKLFKYEKYALSKEQLRVYNALRDDCMADIGEEAPCHHCSATGIDPITEEDCLVCKGSCIVRADTITAILPIVRALRFQQICNGYVATDNGEDPILDLPGPNPKLNRLEHILESYKRPIIVFSRFVRDVDKIQDLCERMGIKAAKYDGRTSNDNRTLIRQQFQAGELDVFNANIAAAYRGITLNRAQTMVFFSMTYRSAHRVQGEDRAHRGIMNHNVTIVDLICPGSIEQHVLENLKKKRDVAALITGDTLKQWLSTDPL